MPATEQVLLSAAGGRWWSAGGGEGEKREGLFGPGSAMTSRVTRTEVSGSRIQRGVTTAQKRSETTGENAANTATAMHSRTTGLRGVGMDVQVRS